MDQYSLNVLSNEQIAEDIYQMELDAEVLSQKEVPLPGQFIYIRLSDSYEPLLRRPISIFDYDEVQKMIKIIYRSQGVGTKLLSRKAPGELLDVMGPMGNGFPYQEIETEEKVVLIGGGIGIPPLYYLAKKLLEHGAKVTVLLGYETEKTSFAVNNFSSLENVEIRIASMDGSIGTNGTALALIKGTEQWDKFYTCGPSGMLRAIKEKWQNSSIEGYVSLEERMACGVGACYGCIVRTTDVAGSTEHTGYKKVCADGPVFSFREVIL